MKNGKVLENWVSTVWLACQTGKEVSFQWVPCQKTFPLRLDGK